MTLHYLSCNKCVVYKGSSLFPAPGIMLESTNANPTLIPTQDAECVIIIPSHANPVVTVLRRQR